MKSKVIILRGLPGSGKSSWIKENHPEALVCSADDYFMVNGEYVYDATKIREAQEACFEKFWWAVREHSHPVVIVDNVLHKLWNVSPYMKIAEFRGYAVEIVRCYTKDPITSWERNTHGVPPDKFGYLVKDFERAPRAWNEKAICTG